MNSKSDQLWIPSRVETDLTPDRIDVWRVRLERQPDSLKVDQILSEDEKKRAARFHFERDRTRWTASRMALRAILSEYAGIEAPRLEFEHSYYGKPALRLSTKLSFNLSHAADLALIAVGLEREIGVDIEQIKSGVAAEGIAERFFSSGEVAALSQVPESMKDLAFFNCWTRKEAYIKAIGEGLSMPLHTFTVSLKPEEPASLLESVHDVVANQKWLLRELHPGPGYVGAIVASGHDWDLRSFDWDWD